MSYKGTSQQFLRSYTKTIENCYIEIHQVYFNNFNIPFKTVLYLKIDFLQLKRF